MAAVVTVMSLPPPARAASAPSDAVRQFGQQLPQQLGTLTDWWLPPDGAASGLVIHIQDLHTDAAAQSRIAQLIELIERQLGSTPIAVEGATGPCDTAVYAQMPDPAGTNRAARFLLREGWLTAAEYVAMTRPAVRLWGVEDPQLYSEHVATFRTVGAELPTARQAIATWRRDLERMRDRMFPEPLRRLARLRRTADASESDFDTYLTELVRLARAQSLDVRATPSVYAAARALALLRRTNQRQAQAQRDRLTRIVPRATTVAPMPIDDGRSDDERLLRQAAQLGISNQDVAELSRTAQAHRLLATLRPETLDRELRALHGSLDDALLTTDAQRQLADLVRRAEIIDALIEARLLPDDARIYQAQPDRFQLSELIDATRRVDSAAVRPLLEHEATLAPVLAAQGRFYALAAARNEAMVRGALQRRADERAANIILVAGGFHTPGLTARLRELGVAYAVITPTLDRRFDATRYERRILSPELPIASIVAQYRTDALVPPLRTAWQAFATRLLVLSIHLRQLMAHSRKATAPLLAWMRSAPAATEAGIGVAMTAGGGVELTQGAFKVRLDARGRVDGETDAMRPVSQRLASTILQLAGRFSQSLATGTAFAIVVAGLAGGSSMVAPLVIVATSTALSVVPSLASGGSHEREQGARRWARLALFAIAAVLAWHQPIAMLALAKAVAVAKVQTPAAMLMTGGALAAPELIRAGRRAARRLFVGRSMPAPLLRVPSWAIQFGLLIIGVLWSQHAASADPAVASPHISPLDASLHAKEQAVDALRRQLHDAHAVPSHGPILSRPVGATYERLAAEHPSWITDHGPVVREQMSRLLAHWRAELPPSADAAAINAHIDAKVQALNGHVNPLTGRIYHIAYARGTDWQRVLSDDRYDARDEMATLAFQEANAKLGLQPNADWGGHSQAALRLLDAQRELEHAQHQVAELAKQHAPPPSATDDRAVPWPALDAALSVTTMALYWLRRRARTRSSTSTSSVATSLPVPTPSLAQHISVDTDTNVSTVDGGEQTHKPPTSNYPRVEVPAFINAGRHTGTPTREMASAAAGAANDAQETTEISPRRTPGESGHDSDVRVTLPPFLNQSGSLDAPDEDSSRWGFPRRLGALALDAPAVMVVGLTALHALGAGPAQAMLLGLIAAPIARIAFLTAVWLHEIGHVVAGRLRGHPVTRENLRGNVPSWSSWLRGAMPLTSPLSQLPSVRLPGATDADARVVRPAGPLASALVAVVASSIAWLGLPSIDPSLGLLGWTAIGGVWIGAALGLTELVGPRSRDIFYCGNLGMLVRRLAGERAILPMRVRRDISRMGFYTRFRGEQAAGGVVFAENRRGQTVAIWDRLVNFKRMDLPKQLDWMLARDVRVAANKSRLRGLSRTIRMMQHYRFGTSSAPAKHETHPHRWLPQRPVAMWHVVDGKLQRGTEQLATFISHNGDFDAWKLYGEFVPFDVIATWLGRVMGPQETPTNGDSPKIAGMMDLLFTQGQWDASVRWAFLDRVSTSLNDDAPTPARIGAWSSLFERVFVELSEAGRLQGARTSLGEMSSASRQLVADAVLRAVRDRAERDRLAASLPQQQRQDLEAAGSQMAAIDPDRLGAFINEAVNAFFTHDLTTSVQTFMSRAEGSFGLVVSSTAEPDDVVLAAWNQPKAVGFSDDGNRIGYGSSMAAMKVRGDDGQYLFPWRYDLDDANGEVVRVGLAEQGVVMDTYNLAGHPTTKDIDRSGRFLRLEDNPLITPLPPVHTKDPVGGDLRDIPRLERDIREHWSQPDSFNGQTATAFVERILERAGTRRGPGVRDWPDMVIYGEETSFELAKQFADDLKVVLPWLNVLAVSSNEILNPDFDRRYHLDASTMFLGVSQSGETFQTLAATRWIAKQTSNLFVMTGEWDTKMGEAVGQRYFESAPFVGRIFSNLSGIRPAEPSTAASAAAEATLSELLLRVAENVRASAGGNGPPLGMVLQAEDISSLRRSRDQLIDETLPDLIGVDAQGRRTRGATYRQLVRQGRRWAWHTMEGPIVGVLTAVIVATFKHAALPLFPTDFVALVAPHFIPLALKLGIDASFFLVFGWFVTIGVRLATYPWLKRPILARRGGRTLVVVDTPTVHRRVQAYYRRLWSLAWASSSMDIKSTDTDSLPHDFAPLVQRGTLILAGQSTLAPDANALKVGLNQVNGIRSLGVGPEIAVIGSQSGESLSSATHQLRLPGNGSVSESAEMSPQRRQALERLYESRVAAHERYLSYLVIGWAWVRAVTRVFWWPYWKTLSYIRVATTRAPRGPKVASPTDAVEPINGAKPQLPEGVGPLLRLDNPGRLQRLTDHLRERLLPQSGSVPVRVERSADDALVRSELDGGHRRLVINDGHAHQPADEAILVASILEELVESRAAEHAQPAPSLASLLPQLPEALVPEDPSLALWVAGVLRVASQSTTTDALDRNLRAMGIDARVPKPVGEALIEATRDANCP